MDSDSHSHSLRDIEDYADLLEDLEESDAPEPRRRPALTAEERKSQERQRGTLFQSGSTYMPTSRDEIIGIDNVLGEIEELIHWLRHSEEYGKYKSRLQPGVIFSGRPGTGKTLVSRWIATASEALFINVRDFVHKNALFTDADIRELFAMARTTYATTKRPIILFWDEFENAAYERSGDKSTPEQRAVVSQLTAELDGIHGKNQGLLLIGCTNYSDSIDAALRRRGRMGVEIEFHAPDRAGKEKILSYYLGSMKTTEDIDAHTLSYFFSKNSTAADIEEACVEAWRHAVRRSIDTKTDPLIANDDLVKVFIKQLVGPPTTFTIPVNERMPIAIHEAGHAIAALAFGVPLRLVTVQPGKKALGRVMTDEAKEYIGTVKETISHMCVGLGGMAAERTAGLDPMTGASNDIKSVNTSAEFLVDHLATGEYTGLFNLTAMARSTGYSHTTPQISEESVLNADTDVRALLERVQEETYYLLDQVGKANVLKIAAEVNERVTMTGREFEALFLDVVGQPASELVSAEALV